MPPVDRFSVSLDAELLAAFDHHITSRGYTNRSEAVRDLIRESLLEARLDRAEEPVAAVLSIVCDHRQGSPYARIRARLGTHSDLTAGSLIMTIDAERDAVIIGLRGPSRRVQALANEIQAMRGVTLGRLSAVPLAQ